DDAEALDIVREHDADLPFILCAGDDRRGLEAMRRGATDYILGDELERLPLIVAREARRSRRAGRCRGPAEPCAVAVRLHDRQEQLAEAQRIANMGSWEYDFATGQRVFSEQFCRTFGLD